MNILVWMSSCAMASLITLHVATRIGVFDIRPWTTPQIQMRLQKISVTWQAVAVAAAWIAAWATSYGDSASLQSIPANSASFSFARFLLVAMMCGVFAGLLCALARIDLACRLLPDRLTLCMIATGIAFHFLTRLLDPADGIIGAIADYGVLWMFAWLFQRLRKREAMGRGDFAMTAGLGAWLGWQSLPLLLMIASSVALAAIAAQRLRANWRITSSSARQSGVLATETAFGPSLAFGGLTAWAAMATGVPLG